MDEGEAIRLFEGRLAEYKHPRRVLFVDSLPRTSIGKVEKKTLRAMAREALEMAALPHA
jgi:malonyl-CoA/methylmalonyl-CoA synthetase